MQQRRASRPRPSFIAIDREDVLDAAREAERQRCFNEMLEHMTLLAQLPQELDPKGRSLFSRACRGAVDAKRQTLLNAAAGEPTTATLRMDFEELCNRVIKLALHQLAFATDAYERVFYRKMAADYYRYIAWFSAGPVIETAQSLYEAADEEAGSALACTDALRLSLALNRAVFTHDILVQRQVAIQIATAALEQVEKGKEAASSSELDSLASRLRENLDVWSWEEAGERSTLKVPHAAAVAEHRESESELERARRALRLELQRCGDENLRYPSDCRIIGYSSIEDTLLSPGFACQFGQRRIIVNVNSSEMSAQDLALVVRSGGGFMEFVDFVHRYGVSAVPALPQAFRKHFRRDVRNRSSRTPTAAGGGAGPETKVRQAPRSAR